MTSSRASSLRGDETVIDAGCGTGRVTEQLLERLPRGRVIALDVSPAMLAEAAARLARFGERVTLVEADLNRPLPVAEPVDAILSTATFHWVLDQEALPGHLAAALRPGGQLVAQCGGEGNCAIGLRRDGGAGRAPARPAALRRARPGAATAGRGPGSREIEAWLTPEPVVFESADALEAYLATVFLGPLTDRPAAELPALAQRSRSGCPEPVLDYVRLNLVARRA